MDEGIFKGLEVVLVFGVIIAICVHQLFDVRKAQRTLAAKQQRESELQQS